MQDRPSGQRQAAWSAARAASAGAVDAYLVGLPAFGYDMQQAEFADLSRIELVAVPVTILILQLGIGAPVAALLPLAVAAAGLLGTVALLAALSPIPTNAGALIIASAMGMGIGVDYALSWSVASGRS